MKDYLKTVLSKLKKDWKSYNGLIIGLGAYVILAYLLKFSICPFLRITGLPCPGCGMTRALAALLRGDFVRAFQYHAFIYPIVLIAIVVLILHYFTPCDMKWLEKFLTVFGILMILYYIYRMIRYFPDRQPMQYNKQSLSYLLYLLFGRIFH